MMIWPLMRMLGLRAASAVVAGFTSPFWRWVILGAGVVVTLALWSGHQRESGREQERAAFATASAEAEARALRAAIDTEVKRQAQEIHDEKELAVEAVAEAKVRNETQNDGVLLRADDQWLQSKRRAAAAGR